jgi:glycosyltransferase involved in cell wall biosynthesis
MAERYSCFVNKPLVSIIIPAYNHEKYIAHCIKSVLAQAYGNWEIIAVDDCSTDKTFEIINSFNDKRISCIRHKANYGKERLADSHNEALSVARGEFVTVLEGDDYWPEYRLEKQAEVLSGSSAVLVHGAIALDKEGIITIWKGEQSCSDEVILNKPRGSMLRALLSGMNPIYAQSVMIRRSALEKIGGFTQSSALYLVDFPTWMELAFQGEFAFIPEVLGYWRRYPSSLTSLYQKELWLGLIDCINIFIENRRKEIESCPVELSVNIMYPAAYAYDALF